MKFYMKPFNLTLLVISVKLSVHGVYKELNIALKLLKCCLSFNIKYIMLRKILIRLFVNYLALNMQW